MRSLGLSSPKMTVCKVSLALLSSLLSVAASQASFHESWFPEYGYDSLKDGTEPVPSFKKIPNEDKAFKKPVYALDAEELLLKSGSAYCQEIQPKDTDAGTARKQKQKQLSCYRCKDPSNGSVYEHCSYSSQPRSARSNGLAKKNPDSLGAPSSTRSASSASGQPQQLPDSFRFSEDYFSPQASEDLPTAEYEKKVDNCERVVKDSMVCMLCKDPKSNGKYEQCSYVSRPNQKAYAYTKSSSFGGAGKKPRSQALKAPKAPEPAESAEEAPEEAPEVTHLHLEHEPSELAASGEEREEREERGEQGDREEAHHSHYVPEHSYHYPSYGALSELAAESDGAAEGEASSYEQEDGEEASPSQRSAKSKPNCRSVKKDGQNCQVCVEPKTGAQSEKCNYSHEPKDKLYRYSKSKSFGYPESERPAESHRAPHRARPPSRQAADSSEGQDTGYEHDQPSSLDYVRSESEKISKKVQGSGDCRQEKRDSMVCTVCKDPKTGGDFEQCNYSFEPKDKVFAYSKSKHFGSPTKGAGDEEEYSGPGSSEEHTQETYSLPVIHPTGTSPLDYIPKSSESHVSNVYASKKPQEKSKTDSKVDHGFYDATVRRAEIEKIVKDMGTEDRSKCKKMLRGDMTCYRCTDDSGVTNEECVFVNEPAFQQPSEQKTVQVASEAATTIEATVKPTLGTPSPPSKLLEPMTSASWKSPVGQRKIRQTEEEGDGENEQQEQQQQQEQQRRQQQPSKDKDEELEVLDEDRDEAEPYDYVSETRPVYDKVLGITLPAYMVHKSPHEIEFDQMVVDAKF